MNNDVFRLVATLCGCLLTGWVVADEFIAGLTPDVRPAGAPRIETHAKDGDWYQRALTGVSRPYPNSLRFLEDQGAWSSPFIVPGMTGPYDIRNWHPSAQAGGNQDAARR